MASNINLDEKSIKEIEEFVDLYNKGVIGKERLFLLLPRKDAEAVIIGSKAGKDGAEIVKKVNVDISCLASVKFINQC